MENRLVNVSERAYPGWALGIASLAIFLSSVSAAIIPLALKPLLAELHGGGPALVWLSIAYLVPYVSVLPVSGKLADTWGQRPVLLWGLAIFSLSSALAGVAWDVPSLIVFRTLQGVGGAVLMISLAFVVAAFADSPRQGFALGLWRAMLLGGTVGGPVIGGVLTATLGWRSAFWATAPVALLGFALAWTVLREPRALPQDKTFDWVGGVATVAGLSALIVVMNLTGLQMGATPTARPSSSSAAVTPQSVATWILYLVVIVSALALWRSLSRHARPILNADLLGIPRFVLANVGTLIICVGMFSAMFFVPLFLQFQQHLDPLRAAAAVLPISVAAVTFGLLGGWLADRLGATIPSVAGFALLAIGFGMLAQLQPTTPYAYTFVALVLSGIGMSLPLAPTAVAAVSPPVPQENQGEAAAIFNLSHNLGRPLALATFGVGLNVSSAATFDTIFWLSAATAMAGAVSALGLGGLPERGRPLEAAHGHE